MTDSIFFKIKDFHIKTIQRTNDREKTSLKITKAKTPNEFEKAIFTVCYKYFYIHCLILIDLLFYYIDYLHLLG